MIQMFLWKKGVIPWNNLVWDNTVQLQGLRSQRDNFFFLLLFALGHICQACTRENQKLIVKVGHTWNLKGFIKLSLFWQNWWHCHKICHDKIGRISLWLFQEKLKVSKISTFSIWAAPILGISCVLLHPAPPILISPPPTPFPLSILSKVTNLKVFIIEDTETATIVLWQPTASQKSKINKQFRNCCRDI